MAHGHFDKIKQHCYGDTVFLKVDSDGNISFVIRGCPRISCEVESSLMFLVSLFKRGLDFNTHLQHFGNPFPTSHEDFFDVTGDGFRRWYVVTWPAGFHN